MRIVSPVPGGGGELAFGEGHVWATVFQIPITEFDPATNTVVRQWFGPGGDSIRAAARFSVAFTFTRAQRLASEPKGTITSLAKNVALSVYIDR